MKPESMLRVVAFSLVLFLIIFSCKKEFSCEGCWDNSTTTVNKAPIANAGSDQTIMLPKDSVLLDGSASFDPDGMIEQYKWEKLKGPSTAHSSMPNAVKTIVTALQAGVYQFQLTITDNGGLKIQSKSQ